MFYVIQQGLMCLDLERGASVVMDSDVATAVAAQSDNNIGQLTTEKEIGSVDNDFLRPELYLLADVDADTAAALLYFLLFLGGYSVSQFPCSACHEKIAATWAATQSPYFPWT